MKYKIIRMYQDDRENKVIKRGLTLKQAQTHCQDPATSGDGWFDGYDKYDAEITIKGLENALGDALDKLAQRDKELAIKVFGVCNCNRTNCEIC